MKETPDISSGVGFDLFRRSVTRYINKIRELIRFIIHG